MQHKPVGNPFRTPGRSPSARLVSSWEQHGAALYQADESTTRMCRTAKAVRHIRDTRKRIEVGSARHDLDREGELDLGVEPHPHLVVAERLDWLEGEETMTVEDDSRLLLDRIDHVALGD